MTSLKKWDLDTLDAVIYDLKLHALHGGHYPTPVDVDKYHERGPVPFASMAYGTAIRQVTALERIREHLRGDK